jgi:hypothetical protein
MKVLSVRQPFAALLVSGAKRLEARSWDTSYRGPLLIHASSSAISAGAVRLYEFEPEFIEVFNELGWRTKEALQSLPRSAIIGQVTLDDVVPSLDLEDAPQRDIVLAADPDEGTYFWRVSHAIPFEPLPIDGKLKLWELPPRFDDRVRASLDRKNSPPDWLSPPNGGSPLRLQLVDVSPALARVLGPEARPRRAIWNDLFDYLESRGLIRGSSVELNEELAALAGGKKRVRISTLANAVADQLVIVEDE